MARLDEYFADYAGYHKTLGNRVCHAIGIPMIFVAYMGLWTLARAEVAGLAIDGGKVLVVTGVLSYLFLDAKLALLFGAGAIGAYYAGAAIPWPALVALFVLGWVFQLAGHWYYERNSPAFAKNLIHVIVGPLWVLDRMSGSARTRHLLAPGK